MIGIIALALAAATTPAAPRVPVDVVSPETSDISLKLTDALLKALDQSDRLRASGGNDDPELKLAILDASPSGSRLEYLVDLIDSSGVSPRRLASVEGTCQADALAQCATNIVAKAQREMKE